MRTPSVREWPAAAPLTLTPLRQARSIAVTEYPEVDRSEVPVGPRLRVVVVIVGIIFASFAALIMLTPS